VNCLLITSILPVFLQIVCVAMVTGYLVWWNLNGSFAAIFCWNRLQKLQPFHERGIYFHKTTSVPFSINIAPENPSFYIFLLCRTREWYCLATASASDSVVYCRSLTLHALQMFCYYYGRHYYIVYVCACVKFLAIFLVLANVDKSWIKWVHKTLTDILMWV